MSCELRAAGFEQSLDAGGSKLEAWKRRKTYNKFEPKTLMDLKQKSEGETVLLTGINGPNHNIHHF